VFFNTLPERSCSLSDMGVNQYRIRRALPGNPTRNRKAEGHGVLGPI
jgi:hypothetical protein